MSRPDGKVERTPVDLSTRVALSIAEAAQALGVSEAHLRRHLSDVPHTHLGERVLFPVEALRTWLTAQVRTEQQQSERDVNDILRSLQK